MSNRHTGKDWPLLILFAGLGIAACTLLQVYAQDLFATAMLGVTLLGFALIASRERKQRSKRTEALDE